MFQIDGLGLNSLARIRCSNHPPSGREVQMPGLFRHTRRPGFCIKTGQHANIATKLHSVHRTMNTMTAMRPFPVSVLQLDHQPIARFDAAKDRLLHMDWVIVTNHDQEESPSSTLTDLSCYIWQRRTIETPISDRRRTVKPQFPHGDHLKMLPNIV